MTEAAAQAATAAAATQAAAGSTQGATGGEGDGGKGEGSKRAIAEARAEAKQARERADAADARLQEFEQSRTSQENDRLAKQKEFETLSKNLQTENQTIKTQLAQQLAERKKDKIRFELKQKFPTLKDTYVEKLFPFDKVKVTDDGTLTGFNDAVAAFETDFPDITKTGGGTQTAAAQQAGQGNGGESAEQRAARIMRENEAARGAGQTMTGEQRRNRAMQLLEEGKQAILKGTAKVFGSTDAQQ